MKVTVVIACRNEAPTLDACLDALEGQDHPDVEVLLVDGSSTDGSGELARRRGFRVLADEGKGPGAARNIGIRAAQSEVVAFTDADCVPRFDWLSTLVARFDEPRVAGVAGGLRLPRTTLLGRMEDNDARLLYSGYITSNVAYRRAVLREVDGFDETLSCAEDYDLAWRILDAGHRIVQEPGAIVLHAPPEVQGRVSDYLRKQFWYARKDIPSHARAIARALRAPAPMEGSSAAVKGLRSALRSSGAAAGVAAGALLRSPGVAGAALALTLAGSARHVRRGVRAVGEGREEVAAMVAIEASKRLVRGVGTLVGVAELARPSAWSALRPGAGLARAARRPLVGPPPAS